MGNSPDSSPEHIAMNLTDSQGQHHGTKAREAWETALILKASVNHFLYCEISFYQTIR
jgi:hypothetical protein